MASSSSNVVGVHYRVGKKIGEGSFGVIFEGTNLLNNQQVAIKFVRLPRHNIVKYKWQSVYWQKPLQSQDHNLTSLFCTGTSKE